MMAQLMMPQTRKLGGRSHARCRCPQGDDRRGNPVSDGQLLEITPQHPLKSERNFPAVKGMGRGQCGSQFSEAA